MAVAVAAAAIVAVLAVAVLRQDESGNSPVAIAAVPAPQAETTECRSLLDALPETLGEYRRAATVQPAPAGTAAWQREPGTEPVILRCGLDRPADFVVGAPLQVVDAVQWFRVGEGTGDRAVGEGERSTWYAVDRPVYVALTLPPGSGPTPIQVVSAVTEKTLPARQIDPAPPR